MPNVMTALLNIGGALCSTQQVWLMPTTRVPCSNAAKTRNPLKFAEVPQTPEPILAVSGPKVTILWGYVQEILLLNKFFRSLIYALVAKIQPNKVVRWCRAGDSLHHFCILYFQRAACSTFQTCILNSHEDHTMSRSMVDIHYATAPIRRGKKEERRKIEEETTGQNIMACPIPQGGHNNKKN